MEPDSGGHAERPAVTAGRRGARHRSGTTRQMTRAVTPASPAETPLRSPGAVVSDRASFDQVRGRLLGIGYRITGTWADAEDAADEALRSEEHTSELQSRGHLVCRLLLEKKKKNRKRHRSHMQRPS